MNHNFRPWGGYNWIFSKLPGDDWSLLGALGTEDRCTAVLDEMGKIIVQRRFLKILDPHMSPEAEFNKRYAEIKDRLRAANAQEHEFREVDLLHDIDTMQEEVDAFLSVAGPRVILDITSLPKRWFFPVIRMLLDSKSVDTLVVTYASARQYSEKLSSDPAALAPLPTFDAPRASESYDELIVGVGFAPLGLKDLFEVDIGKIRYLFPFPPGPPNLFRNWHFLRLLEAEVENRNLKAEDRWNVHMYDVSTVFDALRKVTDGGNRSSALAPFGPKTISLAMCLFALAAEKAGKEPVHVFYTQPRRYSIDYSRGIGVLQGAPDIKAYCVRLGGRDVYSL